MADKPREADPVEQAYRRHYRNIYRFLLRKTGNHEDAEDLTQRVFADAAASLTDARPRSVRAWLYTVAQRRFVDEVRRRSSAAAAQPRLDPPARAELESGRPAARALRRALAQLDPAQRQIVAMKLFEGRSFGEIGNSIGISEAAAKMRMARALRMLRGLLEDEGVEP